MRVFRNNFFALRGAAAAAALFACALLGASEVSTFDLRGLQLKNAKIPIFNQDKLQIVIFSGEATRRAENILGINTVLTIIRKGVTPDAILDDWDLVPYPLDAPLAKVLDFWKERIVYCEGVMTTREAEISQNSKSAGGSRKVFFRSPLLDLDGVGFEADFDRRTITVKSRVRIKIRQSSADPETLLKTPGKLPEKYEYIAASGDSLLIDSRRNEVMLIGNVRVDEARVIMTCDRLTIFWGQSSGEEKKAKNRTGRDEFGNTGIDRIFADGDVVIAKRDNPDERVVAEHLIYDVPKGTAKLSGDDTDPKIISGDGNVLSGKNIYFERDTKRGLVSGSCRVEIAAEKGADGKPGRGKTLTSDNGFLDSIRNFAEFTGNVRMNDGDNSISCRRMRLVTAERPRKDAAPKPTPAADGGATGSMIGELDIGGGGKVLKIAYFHDDVELAEKGGSRLRCEEMHADFASDADGGAELAGAQWFRNVRIEIAGTDGAEPGVLTSDHGELDAQKNRVSFDGHVKGRRAKSTLNCDKLDLYLAAKRGRKTSATDSISIGVGGDRVLRKVVATDNVTVTDASGKLDCDTLTLFFAETPPGGKSEPGMFQAGEARLTDVLADGHVKAVNSGGDAASAGKQIGAFAGSSSGPRVLRADHGRADLTRHISHFSGNVRINDDENQLDCNEMFMFGKHAPAAAAGAKNAAAEAPEDPDADPFALPGFTEDNIPAAINITDNVRLRKILWLGDVKLKRTDPDTKRIQEAGGSRCEYLPEARLVTLTDTPPRRPWLRAEGRQQYGSRIVYDLSENIFKSYDTDTFTIEPARK